ncbi:MAG: hypothetical protein U0790_13985 [Isosphaeraceae bacterium]
MLIQAPSLTVSAGGVGAFDVVLVNTNPSGGEGFDVAGFQVVLSLSGLPGVVFTGASIETDPTAAPYLFVSSATTLPNGPPLSADAFPNTQFSALDIEFAGPGFRTVGPGETFGLAHVSFSVDPGAAAGVYSLVISPSTDSLLTDVTGNLVPFEVVNGSIIVVAEIPEPWSLTQGGISLAISIWLLRRRGWSPRPRRS